MALEQTGRNTIISPQELIIETENLSKSYGNVTALKSLSLKVPKNSIFGFLGPNGAGKTTTIKLLLGLTHPTGGNGKVFNEEIEGRRIEIRKRVGARAALGPTQLKDVQAPEWSP